MFFFTSLLLTSATVGLVSCQVGSEETTVSPAEACYQDALAADSSLRMCDQNFADIVTNVVPSVAVFCPSDCAEKVALARHNCRCESATGQSGMATRFGQLDPTVNLGDIILTACARGEDRLNNTFCGDLIDWNLSPDYNVSLEYANGNCTGNDCSDPDCKAAFDALGCCAELAFLSGVLRNVTEEAFRSCNVERCSPVPFTLPDMKCGESPTTSAPLVMAVAVVLLAVAQLLF